MELARAAGLHEAVRGQVRARRGDRSRRGFRLFARLERLPLYFVFGPLEWAWRSLTYVRRQPMHLAPAAAASTVQS